MTLPFTVIPASGTTFELVLKLEVRFLRLVFELDSRAGPGPGVLLLVVVPAKHKTVGLVTRRGSIFDSENPDHQVSEPPA